MTDTELIARFRQACEDATDAVEAPSLFVPARARRARRTRWGAPLASAVLAGGAALGAFMLQQQLGATAHRSDATVQFAGVCDSPYNVPARPGHVIAKGFRVGDIVVAPAGGTPVPSEATVRAQLRKADLPVGAQLRWASIIEPALSPTATDHWLLTSCGQPGAFLRPTATDPSPMSRIYQTATYSVVGPTGQPGQPFTVQLNQPQCPHRIGTAGGPSNGKPSSARLVDGHVTAGLFCRYYSVLPGPGNKYPGTEHGAAGIPPDLAAAMAKAINALPPASGVAMSCPNDIGVTDVLSFQTSNGPQQVWVSATGCNVFKNGARVAIGSGPAMATYLELRARLVLPSVR
ncbi:MAG: hypothetical protein JWP11_856 [Frankiales bacterium]|nr:hypothetical protein [Frankiales bacterium]